MQGQLFSLSIGGWTKGLGDRSPTAGSSGRACGEGLGVKPQKLNTFNKKRVFNFAAVFA